MITNQEIASTIPALDSSPLLSIDTALRHIFTSTQEETLLTRSRRIMGNVVTDLTDEELEIYIIELQHLIDFWLDNFERQLFDNQTLQQVLGHE